MARIVSVLDPLGGAGPYLTPSPTKTTINYFGANNGRGTVPFTVIVWFRPTTIPVAASSGNIIGFFGPSFTNNIGISISDTTSKFAPYCSNNVGTFNSFGAPGSALTTNKWYCGAGIAYTASSRKAFIRASDSTTVSTATDSGTNTYDEDVYVCAASQYFDGSNFTGGGFDGDIGECAAWDVALSDNEVNAILFGARPYTVRGDRLVAYWPLFGLASPEPDLSGHAHNMTLVNGGGGTVPGHYDDPPMTLWTPKRFQSGVIVDESILRMGKQYYDRPPTYRGQRRGASGLWSDPDLRTWVSSRVLTTLKNQDKLNPGKQITDLSPRQILYDGRWRNLRSWSWQYNKNLIGKDKFPPGIINTGDITDLTRGRPDPVYWYQNWTLSLNTTTLGQVVFPENQYDWPLPSRYPRIEQSWYRNYNLNLIGQDQLPPGDSISYRLRGRPEPITWYRDWTLSLNTTTLGFVALPPGSIVYDLPRGAPRSEQSWYWAYNLNLIAQDKLPTGEVIFDLPPRGYPRLEQSWYWAYNINLIGKDQLPTGKTVYELSPRGYLRVEQSWYRNYNLNLIGKDRLPTGAQITERTPIAYEPSPRRSWTWNYNLNLINQDQLPFRQTDWPTPLDYKSGVDRRNWYWSYNLNLINQDRLPFRQTDWPYPRGNIPLLQTWFLPMSAPLILSTFSLPPGVMPGNIVYAIPPAHYVPPLMLNQRSWEWKYNLNLIAKDAMTAAFRKESYELPPAYYVPKPINQQNTWAWRYNPNLVGKDTLPTGRNVYELAPAYYVPPLQFNQRNYTFRHNFALVTVETLLPRNRESYELPLGWQEVTRRPLQIFYEAPFIPRILPITPVVPIPAVMDGNDLALIHNQQFVFYTPDDIFTVRTRHIYLNMETPIDPFTPLIMVFYRPNGSFFTMTFPFVRIGTSDILTPKGVFLAGRYFIYTVASDHFRYPGIWKCSHQNDGIGANFYVKQPNVRQLH